MVNKSPKKVPEVAADFYDPDDASKMPLTLWHKNRLRAMTRKALNEVRRRKAYIKFTRELKIQHVTEIVYEDNEQIYAWNVRDTDVEKFIATMI